LVNPILFLFKAKLANVATRQGGAGGGATEEDSRMNLENRDGGIGLNSPIKNESVHTVTVTRVTAASSGTYTSTG